MRQIYLDNAATTPLLPEVRDEVIRSLTEDFGNPHHCIDWAPIRTENQGFPKLHSTAH